VLVTITKCDVCEQIDAAELRFSVGGKDLAIDLCDDCRQKWNATIGVWIAAARPAPRRINDAAAAPKPKAGPSYDRTQLKAWAAAHDVELPSRGRIPRAILERYEAWTNGPRT